MKRLAIWTLACLLVGVPGASGQLLVDFQPTSSVLSREELTELLSMYNEVIQSPEYSGRMKDAARESAARVQERLERGDFRVGDGVVLSVQGEAVPDTLRVEPGPKISLELFGDISLGGVLRSEVEEYLTVEIGRFIRDPVVRAQALMRLSIQGAVGRPGFYVVPTDMLLSQAIMFAGGPGQTADIPELRLERNSVALLDREEVQEALIQGWTIDQLNLRAGDQIYLPPIRPQGPGIFSQVGRYAFIIGTTLIFGIRVF